MTDDNKKINEEIIKNQMQINIEHQELVKHFNTMATVFNNYLLVVNTIVVNLTKIYNIINEPKMTKLLGLDRALIDSIGTDLNKCGNVIKDLQNGNQKTEAET